MIITSDIIKIEEIKIKIIMATIEPRVNIALDSDTLSLLREIARNTKRSISAICADFVKKQIELDEDAYDIKLIKNLGKINLDEALPAKETRKILDALPD